MKEKFFVNGIKPNENTLAYDVVIVGSGVAGLYAALNLDEHLTCAILNKHGESDCNSIYAQGGIASVLDPYDNVESHIKDTLIAGAGLCDEAAVRTLVTEGPSDIKQLIETGVPFDRENGKLSLSREGAHSCNRIVHCGGDATGYHVTVTLLAAIKKKSNVRFYNNCMVCDVITDTNNRVWGVTVKSGSDNFCIRSKNVIMASGGIGRLYRNTTNSNSCTGDGIAAAIRAGAAYDNMEFVQFHPTALIHPDLNKRFFLISEALRGEGGILLNRKGERFMEGSHPMAELAPRDIVSRSIISEMRKNDLPCVYLDVSFKGRDYLKKRFPVIYEECMKRGIDIAVNWIPVIPVQHYFMGGIKTDLQGATNIEGLYACGEASCTGVHGANRLASNSLLECLVFGRRSAQHINGRSFGETATPVLYDNSGKGSCDFETFRSKIKYAMTKNVSIIRCKDELIAAREEIGGYFDILNKCAHTTVREAETLNMAFIALKVIDGALARRESIGAHYRVD